MVFTTLIGLAFVTIYAAKVHWSIAPAYLLTVPLLGSLSSLLTAESRPSKAYRDGDDGPAARRLNPCGTSIVKSLALLNKR